VDSAVTAADAMHTGVATVGYHQTAQEVLRYLLSQRISGAAVLDSNNRAQGVITLADLAAHAAGMEKDHPARHLAELCAPPHPDSRWQADFRDQRPVGELMTPFLVRVPEATPLTEVIELMVQTGIHRVFVMRDEALVGVISSLDLVGLLGQILQSSDKGAGSGPT
jgi:CBS domain-containing protein